MNKSRIVRSYRNLNPIKRRRISELAEGTVFKMKSPSGKMLFYKVNYDSTVTAIAKKKAVPKQSRPKKRNKAKPKKQSQSKTKDKNGKFLYWKIVNGKKKRIPKSKYTKKK